MKSLLKFILFFVSLFGFMADVHAQKPLGEVTLQYAISIESVNDKALQNKPLEGATLTVYIKGKDSKTEMVSSMGTESTLFSAGTGKGFILKEYSGQKLMISLTSENWAQKNRYFNSMDFSIDNTEQQVAGFKCWKAVASLENGKTLEVYFIPGIETMNNEYNNAFTKLPGIPVKYELESGKLRFSYLLKNISYENIPSGKFEYPKSGYRVMTYEENQQLKKG